MVRGTTHRGGWAGYAAWACAWLFAVPNLYWGLGGGFGRDTIGEEAVGLTWGDDPLPMAVVLATGVVKLLAGVFALALVRPWGEALPRRALVAVGWAAAVFIGLYGAVQLGSQLLVALGAVEEPEDFDRWAFRWHLFLWSPWFLVWGLLLGLAVRQYQRSGRAR